MKAMGGGWYEAVVRSGESGRRLTAATTSVLDRRLISPFSPPVECKVRSARDVIDKKMGQRWVDGGGDDDRCIYTYIRKKEQKKKMKTPPPIWVSSPFLIKSSLRFILICIYLNLYVYGLGIFYVRSL